MLIDAPAHLHIPPVAPTGTLTRGLKKEEKMSLKAFRSKKRPTDPRHGVEYRCLHPFKNLPVDYEGDPCCYRPDGVLWFEEEPEKKVLCYVTCQCQAKYDGVECLDTFCPCKRVTDEHGVERWVRLLDVATMHNGAANKLIIARNG
jgi:hypothetical protein